MPTITPETTIGQLVAADKRCAEIFEHLNIDYCCGGQRTLADASREHDLDPWTAARMLEAASLVPDVSPVENNRRQVSLDELAGLEANTHLHVHKENNVLFPQVRALSG